MTLRPWREEWTKGAGIVGVVMVVLFLVLLAVLIYLVPLSRGEDIVHPAERSSTVGGPTSPAPGAANAAGQSAGGVLPTQPGPAGSDEQYIDPMYAFRLTLPRGWHHATVSDDARPSTAADYDVVFEDPATGARLAVSVWDAKNVASFTLWSQINGTGLQSVDGQLPYNALVAGEPALLLWAPESPVTPLRFALFLQHDDRYYRIAYSARDGGGSISTYAKALVSLAWAAGADTTDVLPLRGLPGSRYWPSEHLFGR